MINILISSQFGPPVYLLATLLGFQDFGHLYPHYSGLFFRETSYLLFISLFWWVFTINVHQLHIYLPFHFV